MHVALLTNAQSERIRTVQLSCRVVTNIRLGKLTTNIRTNFEMTTKRNVALCSAYAPHGVNIRRNLLLEQLQ